MASGLPLQVLAAVERQHLSGHRRQCQDRKHRTRDLIGTGATMQRGGGGLPLELLRGLPCIGQRGPGPIPFTRIRGASASAIDCVNVQRPAFATV